MHDFVDFTPKIYIKSLFFLFLNVLKSEILIIKKEKYD